MQFDKVNYKVEAYTTRNDERSLTENDIKEYYKEQGFNVYHKYHRGIREGKYMVSKETIKLFEEYSSGYPDFMLVRVTNPEEIKFVEVKLDNDSLRPNQVHFNTKLAELEDISIIYFNNRARYEADDDFILVSKVPKVEKQIIKRLDGLTYIQGKKGYKPYWVVAQLFKEFGIIILKKNVTSIIAGKTNLKKDSIVWFVKTSLMGQTDTKKKKRNKRYN